MSKLRHGGFVSVTLLGALLGAASWLACSTSSSSGGGGACVELTSCCVAAYASACAALASSGTTDECASAVPLYCLGSTGSGTSGATGSGSGTSVGSSTGSGTGATSGSGSGTGGSGSGGGLCFPCTTDHDCVTGDYCILDGESGNYYCAPECATGQCPAGLDCDDYGDDIDNTNTYQVCYPPSNSCEGWDGGAGRSRARHSRQKRTSAPASSSGIVQCSEWPPSSVTLESLANSASRSSSSGT